MSSETQRCPACGEEKSVLEFTGTCRDATDVCVRCRGVIKEDKL